MCDKTNAHQHFKTTHVHHGAVPCVSTKTCGDCHDILPHYKKTCATHDGSLHAQGMFFRTRATPPRNQNIFGTTPLAVPTSTVFDPSIGPKYIPCSNRETKGPRRRLDGCKSIHHSRSPNCVKVGTARLPTFLSYAVLPSRPTTNRRGMLVAYDTSHVNKSWSAGTSLLPPRS